MTMSCGRPFLTLSIVAYSCRPALNECMKQNKSTLRPETRHTPNSEFPGESKMRTVVPLILLLAAPVSYAQFGGPQNELQQAVTEAMQSEIRTEQERARDRNRQPAQVLDFLGLKQ